MTLRCHVKIYPDERKRIDMIIGRWYCQGLCASLILVTGRNLLQGCFGAPLVTLGRSGRKGSRAAAAACLALDASRADCHSPDQQLLLGDLEMLHIHVFLAAPLCSRHMAKPRADQHQCGVPIRECPHHAASAADLPVQPLDHIVGADACPVLAGKITIGQRFLDAVLDLLGGLLQLHGAQLRNHGLRLLTGCLLALLRMDRLEHFRYNFDLGFGHNGENIAVEMHRAALVSGIREHLAHGLQHPQALVADDKLHAVQTAPRSHWKKLTQLALSSFIPSAAPKTSRKPSSFTAIATKIATFSYSPPQLRRR